MAWICKLNTRITSYISSIFNLTKKKNIPFSQMCACREIKSKMTSLQLFLLDSSDIKLTEYADYPYFICWELTLIIIIIISSLLEIQISLRAFSHLKVRTKVHVLILFILSESFDLVSHCNNASALKNFTWHVLSSSSVWTASWHWLV